MKNKKLTPEYITDEYINKEVSLKEFAKICGVHSVTITRYMKKFGLSKYPSIETLLSKEEFIELYYHQDLSLVDIAAKFNKKYYGTLIRMMKNWNLVKKQGQTKKQKDIILARRLHPYIIGNILSSLRYGAKIRNIIFNITLDDIWNQYIKQNGKCALTGLEIFFPDHSSKLHLEEYSASVDRIDSKLGYEKNNIQIIHKNLNRMKWEINQQDFINYCKLVARKFK